MSPRKPKNSIPDIVEAFKAQHRTLRAPEVATHVVDAALAELKIKRAVYDEMAIARPVMWRGAMSWTRDLLKRRDRAPEEPQAETPEDDDDDEVDGGRARSRGRAATRPVVR